MFHKNGTIKTYNGKTMITLDIIYPILAILSYYIYLIIRIVAK
jgi:hypothetical protein